MTEGFRPCADPEDASLFFLEPSFGGFFLVTSVLDWLGVAEGLVAGLEAFASDGFDAASTFLTGTLLFFLGPSFGISFFEAILLSKNCIYFPNVRFLQQQYLIEVLRVSAC